MFPFTAVIFGAGVILLDYINKIAPYPLIGFVPHIGVPNCSAKTRTESPPLECPQNVKRIKDEIFHIPAAERYCRSNYSYWDPKITTPPGLYIYSSLITKAVGLFINVECDTITLRVQVKDV